MKQKLTLLLIALLSTIGAGATEYTVTYSKSTGSYTATNSGGTWASRWVSTATNPSVTLSVGANNIQVSTGNIYSGGSGCTYTLTAQAGYVITGYTISGTAQSGAQTLTPAAGGSATSFATSGTTTLSVTGLSTSSTSFNHSTPNSGIALSSFTITLTEDPTCVWNPSIADGMLITACTKVTNGTIGAATAADDNDHWYIMTQVRDGESAMYDNGTQAMRASTTYTPDYFVGKNASENAAYLIRFIATGTDGIYNIQYANGGFISSTLSTTNEANRGNYAVYFTDGASALAWNLNSKSGSRVDNNGATKTVSFWGEGVNTATSGNNIWTLYEATVEVPASTVDVTYAQYVNGVATGLTVTETVLPNSSINIPATFTNGYSTLAYDISTEGAIADANVTIKVNIDAKPGLVETLGSLSNSKAYTIKSGRGTFTAYNGKLANTVKSSYAVNNFAIITYEGNYYLWSVEASKFAQCNDNTMGDTPVAITMTSVANGLFKFQGNGNTLNSTSGKETGAIFDNWATTDEGNSCAIIAAADFDATDVLAALDAYFHPATYVVYQLSDATGVIYTTDQVPATAGDIITALPDEFKSAYCTYEVTSTTVVEGENVVPVTVSYVGMPFTSSVDYDHAVWYSLHNASKGKFPYYNGADESYIPLGDMAAEDKFLWAFIGNPVTGYQIVNKAAGAGKYLCATAGGNNVIITVGTTPATFTLVEGPEAGNCGFSLDGFYLNDYAGNGKLSFWQEGPAQDTGSKWIIASISTDVIKLVINVTGSTEAENTRAGKITATLNGAATTTYIYNTDTEGKELVGYTASEFTATATSYRGYEFTGFSIGETDYGTSIEAGELAGVAAGSTLVANYTASEGNGLNLWYDYNDAMTDAYRLPAIIRTQSGRIIAFADYRPGNTDVGIGPTSIERRYSDDGGETWSTALRVAQGNWGVNTANVIEWSFGDPAAVADNTPGNSGNDVLMVCCGGNSAWTSSVYNADVSQRQQGCVAWRSTDGGETWSNYEYIMPALMQACVEAGVRASDGSSGVVRAFFSSGKITQSVRKADGAQYNRIYNALNVNTGNLVIYSDDFGATWKVLGNQVANNGDEAHVVELPDGAVLLVGKGNTSRYVNVFNYTDFTEATGEWGTTNQWNNAVTTTCHGDVEVVEAYDAYGEKNTVVIETSPMTSSPQRREIQYYFIALPKAEGFTTGDFSTQGGASWTQGMNVTHNWGAYSSVLNNGDGTMDILFEECAKDETKHPTGYCLVYQKAHDIKDITLNQYYFDKAQAEAEAVKSPRPGHFYRFKGSGSNAYITAGANNAVTTTAATDASTIWYYDTKGLVSYATGQYLDGSAKAQAAVGTSYAAAIEASTYHEGKYTIRTNGYYSYDQTGNVLDRGSSLNDNARYAWTVEDVTTLPVTVKSLGLATLYSPVGLTAPENVKVYNATKNIPNGTIHFDEIESGEVKAGTGVLVEAEPGTYDFTIAPNDADYTSDLVGSVATVAASSITGNVYTLQSGPAFKLFNGDNVTGFRSHIETEASAGVKAFNVVFGDDETGISDINSQWSMVNGQSIFNLAGQRMSKAQKGVNIINGKKFLK